MSSYSMFGIVMMLANISRIDHPRLSPKSILNKDMIEAYSGDYMYFRCIQYIFEVNRDTLLRTVR